MFGENISADVERHTITSDGTSQTGARPKEMCQINRLQLHHHDDRRTMRKDAERVQTSEDVGHQHEQRHGRDANRLQTQNGINRLNSYGRLCDEMERMRTNGSRGPEEEERLRGGRSKRRGSTTRLYNGSRRSLETTFFTGESSTSYISRSLAAVEEDEDPPLDEIPRSVEDMDISHEKYQRFLKTSTTTGRAAEYFEGSVWAPNAYCLRDGVLCRGGWILKRGGFSKPLAMVAPFTNDCQCVHYGCRGALRGRRCVPG